MKWIVNITKRLALNFYFWVFLSFFISLTFVIFNKFLDPVQKSNTIVSDGKGYYAYLPGIFIYDDLTFAFNQTIEKEKHAETMWTDYRYKLDKDRVYTRYYIGTPIAYLPFFLSAHGISKMMDWDADGYTPIYHSAVLVASLCYMLLAMIFFGKILDTYKIKYWVKVFVILGAYFGTNWFYYTTWEASLSHVYSAGIIAMFWYYCIRFKKNPSFKRVVLLGLLLGFITLLRPVNVLIVLFLPILFMDLKSFWGFVKNKMLTPKIVLGGLLTFFAVISLQLIIYKIQIDQWYIYAYSHEKFYFLQSHMMDFLFSIRKGFFVYTPLFILSIVGLFYWRKDNKFQPIWWLLTFLFITYIFSSWHMWWYGGTLGTRVFIEYYIFWVIPLAMLLNKLKGIPLKVVMTIACLFIFNNILQQYQYRCAILHYDSMTWQNYKDIFLYPIIP
ncbi:MAG: hypothetical protein COA58_15345 [Bacteroidetes bacterium]|nr:MAG: hypothetical protein COA58_15345 [Bacteroidota bacterium]